MKAIVVTDQAAGTAGVKLVERPEPQAAINDVVVQIHASGFTEDELTWPSAWSDRVGRARRGVSDGDRLSYCFIAEAPLGARRTRANACRVLSAPR